MHSRLITLVILLITFLHATATPVPLAQDATATATVDPGQWVYYQVEIPAASPGWRMVLTPQAGSTGNADLNILESGIGWEQVKISLPTPSSGKLFMKLEAQMTP